MTRIAPFALLLALVSACDLSSAPNGAGSNEDGTGQNEAPGAVSTSTGLRITLEAQSASDRASGLASPFAAGGKGNGAGNNQVGNLQELVVTVRSVAAHAAGTGWVIVSATPVTVDLLKLGEAAATLGFANLPAGKITQIRLFLQEGGDNHATTLDGVVHPLVVPSGLQSGIKLKGPFDVVECELGVVSVSLDLEKSILVHARGNSDEFILRPTIHRARYVHDGAPCEAPADPVVVVPAPGDGGASPGEGVPPDAGQCFVIGADAGQTPCDDTDGDGLSDEDEVAIGTDPNDADSDADGLNDGEEVIVTLTNPVATDTDGGGTSDGAEVADDLDPRDPTDDASTAPPAEEVGLCQTSDGGFFACPG